MATVDMNMPILIVDDFRTMLRMTKNLLNQLGFENVDDASDGQAALEKLREKGYQMVISDWNMDPMTGLDLLREIRADEKLKKLAFIMITAECKSQNVIAAKEAGANNYIVKPLTGEILKNKIAAVIGNF